MKDVAVVESDERGVLFDSDEVYIGDFGLWAKRLRVDEVVKNFVDSFRS